MDSGNSGSLQSSSGDEEYDSRAAADSFSAFMNNNNNNNNNNRRRTVQANPLSNVPSQISTTHFDPLSNYFDNISRPPPPPPAVHTPNSFLNLDMPWSKTLRSDHPSSSTDHHMNPAMISNIPSFFGSFTTATPSPEMSINHPPPVAENNSTTISASTAPPPRAASDQSNPTHVVRNPKKRSRASRRAPTTVLTTDTTNFRAMVQEFTGIPAPPFTSSSPFSRTTSRLDLYGTTPPSMRSNIPLDSSQPPYLRRPFPQKVQLPPPPPLPFLASSSSSSSSSSLLNSTTMVVDLDHANNIASTSTAAAALNFQLPPQSSSSVTNLFSNMPNHPILSSLLQSKFSTSNPPPNNIGLEIPSKDSHHKVGGIILDQFGHVNTSSLSGLPGLISPDQTTSRNNNNDNNPVNWDGNGNGNLNLARMNAATNGKINYSASTNSSNFHGDKVTDNVVATSRGEGMVESWICSSD